MSQLAQKRISRCEKNGKTFILLAASRTIANDNRNTLTTEEKADYISSIKCLQSKPAMIPKEAAPGVRTRYDDFTATHANNTVHFTDAGGRDQRHLDDDGDAALEHRRDDAHPPAML